MKSTQNTFDQTDQELSLNDLSFLNGGNLWRAVSYIDLAIGTAGVYPMVDALEGGPRAYKDFR